MQWYLRFPGGRPKALTLSYDDGVVQDARLMEILNRYGLKCTFNLNSGLFRPEDGKCLPPFLSRRLTEAQAVALFRGSGHEVAVHGVEHPYLEQLPISEAMSQVLEDRRRLEALFGGIVRGMAYPFGTHSAAVRQGLPLLGIAYARTVESTGRFGLPADFYRWNPTCHHNHPRLMDLAAEFTETDARWGPQLFYLWGHSYEFDDHDNWDVPERFCQLVSGRKDIWYATNLEICDYITAFSQLRASADGTLVQNPTQIELFVSLDGRTVRLPAGASVRLPEGQAVE